MAGKRKNFLNYSAASAFVVALGLNGMQDWINYAKSGNRPDDIPSNPWTVYKDELAAQGEKFNINKFIGMKLARKPRTLKDPSAPKKPRKQKLAADAVADAPVDTSDDSLTPFEIARNAIQALNLPNREAFYELKRKNMLPVGVPRKPEDTFKNSGWNGWGDFLGNTKKAGADASVTA